MIDKPTVSIATGLPRPHWRGRIHGWAFWLTLPAAIVLLTKTERITERIGVTVFAASLLAVYGVSALYHRMARSERAQRVMRRLDHSMIFVLIAGTYTPVCLVALDGRWPTVMLAVIWTLAAIGITSKFLGSEAVLRFGNSLYLIMGWLALAVLPSLVSSLRPGAVILMVVGGVLYTFGAILFFLRRPDPNPVVFGYHEVWHSFTVVAGASHFAMVALVVT